jgi:hypothetical protein
MTRTLKIAVLFGALCVVGAAAAQTSEAVTTKTKTTQKSGVVETVYGNHVVLKDADGTHEWTVPEGFHFVSDGKELTVAQLQPGMKVVATTTQETTIRDVTLTRNVSGQVAQVAPGGIVVRDSTGGGCGSRGASADGPPARHQVRRSQKQPRNQSILIPGPRWVGVDCSGAQCGAAGLSPAAWTKACAT